MFDGELSIDERKAVAEDLGNDPQVLMELSHHATLGRLIREAVGDQSRVHDLSGVWPAVARQIGMPDPEYVPGWEPIGEAIAAAVAEHGRLEPDVGQAMTSMIMEPILTASGRIYQTSWNFLLMTEAENMTRRVVFGRVGCLYLI